MYPSVHEMIEIFVCISGIFLHLQEAFADDDVLEDFLREKKKGIEDSAPKPEDLTLPGWGEWGGLGVQPSRRKKRKFFIEPKPGPARKDQHLGAVIINEKRDVYIARHQVKQVTLNSGLSRYTTLASKCRIETVVYP